MSKNFEPPGSPAHPEPEKVEVFVYLIDGALWPHEGQFATRLLVKYRDLVAQGGLQGWEIIHALLGDDRGAPPTRMEFRVNGIVVATVPYDLPERTPRARRRH
jgi:hypothetical protein